MGKNHNNRDKKYFSVSDRIRYWFDNRMAKGSLRFIWILIVISIVFAVVIAGLITLLGYVEDGDVNAVLWDSISTVINAWMPSFEDGSLGYLVLMSITAIGGLLFTSVLIGIITSAIEEKIDSLKRGNSIIVENGHIVVLGFNPGEYTLLRQLILAASGKPTCIVIADDREQEDIEQGISENLDVPSNCRIVCRTADITDPSSLEKCSVETCKTIIISPTDDMKTIKAVLAVSTLLEEKGVPEISVNALISKNEYRFPPSIAEANNILTLQTNNCLAKIIAHSCTQTGLSDTFREVFNFEGSEFYLYDITNIDGMSFADLMVRLDYGVPAGVFRDGKIILNPPSDYQLNDSDRILVFSEESDSAVLLDKNEHYNQSVRTIKVDNYEDRTDTAIIGHNETLAILLQELPENVSHVYLAGQNTTKEEQDELERIASERNLLINYYPGDIRSEKVLLELAKMAEHIIVLNDHDRDSEEADMEAIFLLLHLRDIRKRYNLSFNLTVEMRKEHNQKLVSYGDHTDFLVSSRMSSLILAQLSENPELMGMFRELLSNNGNELYLKNVGLMKLVGSHSIRELRMIMLNQGYILLGHLNRDKISRYNMPLDEVIVLEEEDNLIVLGER